jgi:isocitrate dehydrogenase kinase/phosphatase
MDTITTTPSVAQKIAEAMLQGFDKHYRLFRESSAVAKQRFEAGEWAAMRDSVRERIRWYDDRVKEAVDRLRSEFHAQSLDDLTWQQVKPAANELLALVQDLSMPMDETIHGLLNDGQVNVLDVGQIAAHWNQA